MRRLPNKYRAQRLRDLDRATVIHPKIWWLTTEDLSLCPEHKKQQDQMYELVLLVQEPRVIELDRFKTSGIQDRLPLFQMMKQDLVDDAFPASVPRQGSLGEEQMILSFGATEI
jgi:hypothetical protein